MRKKIVCLQLKVLTEEAWAVPRALNAVCAPGAGSVNAGARNLQVENRKKRTERGEITTNKRLGQLLKGWKMDFTRQQHR